jgi:hypothetical protein
MGFDEYNELLHSFLRNRRKEHRKVASFYSIFIFLRDIPEIVLKSDIHQAVSTFL